MAWNDPVRKTAYDAAITIKDECLLTMRRCHTDCVSAISGERDQDALTTAQLTMKDACREAKDQSAFAAEMIAEDGITPENRDEWQDELADSDRLNMVFSSFKAIS